MKSTEAPSEALRLVAGIVGTLVVIGVIFAFIYLAKSKADTAANDMIRQSDALLDSKYTDYDGKLCTGSEVLSCIQKFKSDQIYICVDGNYYNRGADLSEDGATAKLADAQNKLDLSKYINPSSNYTGLVMYDASNSIIMGIEFTLTP